MRKARSNSGAPVVAGAFYPANPDTLAQWMNGMLTHSQVSYPQARPLGLILSTFALWTLSYMKILPFRRCAIVAVLLVLGTAAWLGRTPRAGAGRRGRDPVTRQGSASGPRR